jgi:AcrR family transcriptional regulator/transposase-like protein
MNPKTFPALMERIRELTPRQREQLRGALAMPAPLAEAATESPAECPHCAARRPVRYGRVRGQQRWRCAACRRTFGLATGTPLLGLHRKSAWTGFAQALGEGLSVRSAAERCGIHRDTAARWRRRALNEPAAAPQRTLPKGAPSAPQDGAVTDPRALRTRQALRRALLALMARKQFDGITARGIAAEARVGYATFFRHYGSKADLLDEVAAEQVGRLMGLSLPLVETIEPRAACLLLCRYVSSQRALWSALLSGGAAGVLRRECVRLAVEHSRVRHSDWLPVELGATHGVSAMIEIVAWWLRHPDRQSAEQIAEILYRLVMQPLMAGSFASGS